MCYSPDLLKYSLCGAPSSGSFYSVSRQWESTDISFTIPFPICQAFWYNVELLGNFIYELCKIKGSALQSSSS